MTETSGLAAEWAMAGERALSHNALLYKDTEEFLSVAVPFVRAGLEAGDAVAVYLTEASLETMREALGSDASSVQFADSANAYTHPVRTLSASVAFINALAPRRMRVVAGEILESNPRRSWPEWFRFEWFCNTAVKDARLTTLCCYNRSFLPPEAVEYARQTHPATLTGNERTENPGVTGTGSVSTAFGRQPLPSSPQTAASMHVDPADLHTVRNFIADQARRYGMAPGPLQDLLVAVTEVVTNAIRHGTSPITLRSWSGESDLFCEIVDSGDWRPDDFIGWMPPQSASEPGFGLWGVRMLCDIVEVRSAAEGTKVLLRHPL
ncbi:sensor histidine kinase [Allosalinactinospora lopnorensis]|uniref:sensor histidine kinase n=1 Tax=Allosalinactinospora lopnorensis TaxID=1352348 RepID=UPI000623EA41|nr:sensor histidine kinase [Allosalinactinospora lopnorensis]